MSRFIVLPPASTGRPKKCAMALCCLQNKERQEQGRVVYYWVHQDVRCFAGEGGSRMAEVPSLSTDQVAAFVELARQGTLRGVAGVLHITEQGVRNRLVALERRLGAELYRKARGPRRTQPLTEQGRQFLPHALAFLERAAQLAEVFR